MNRTLEELEAEIVQRDYDDSHRAHSPLRQAADAVLIDTSDLTLEEVTKELLRRVREGEK